MEPKFRTSFIPKAPIVAATAVKRTRGTGSLLFLLAVIVFLGSSALAIGTFLYTSYLEASLQSKKESLERARAAFEPALIQELTRLDSRLSVGRKLLHGHLAATGFFSLLEQNTLQGIRFKNLKFDAQAPDRITISMAGEAVSFGAVALQSDAFGRIRTIRDPIFSDLNIDQKGAVVFNFSAFVDPSVVSYERVISERGTPPAPTNTGDSSGEATTTQTP